MVTKLLMEQQAHWLYKLPSDQFRVIEYDLNERIKPIDPGSD